MGLLSKYFEKKKRKRLEKEIEDKKRQLNIQQEKTKKMEEEVNKMVKLELKDGKLQKVEDIKEVPDTLPPLSSMPRPPTPAERDAEDLVQRQTEAVMMQMERDRQQQQFLNQQAALAQQQQMAAYAQQQQMAALAQQQQMAAYAQQHQIVPEESNVVTFHILMTEGREAKEEVSVNDVAGLIEEISEAISSCTTFTFGQRMLNGRYILEFMYY